MEFKGEIALSVFPPYLQLIQNDVAADTTDTNDALINRSRRSGGVPVGGEKWVPAGGRWDFGRWDNEQHAYGHADWPFLLGDSCSGADWGRRRHARRWFLSTGVCSV